MVGSLWILLWNKQRCTLEYLMVSCHSSRCLMQQLAELVALAPWCDSADLPYLAASHKANMVCIFSLLSSSSSFPLSPQPTFPARPFSHSLARQRPSTHARLHDWFSSREAINLRHILSIPILRTNNNNPHFAFLSFYPIFKFWLRAFGPWASAGARHRCVPQKCAW